MSFGLNAHSHNLPFVSTFAEAVKAWQKIEPLRGSLASDPKPLGRRERRNPKWVRVESDPTTGEPTKVIFRYHATDIVTWHDDNTCVIRPWPSKSTREFINCVTPRGVYIGGAECDSLEVDLPPEDSDPNTPHIKKVMGGRVCETRAYATNGRPITVKVDDRGNVRPLPDADQPSGTSPVERYRIDRKRANALYKRHRVAEFMTFFDAYIATSGYQPMPGDERLLVYTDARGWMSGIDDLLSALENDDRAQWPEVAQKLEATYTFSTHCSRIETPAQMLRWMIRRAHQEQAYHKETVRYAPSRETLRRIDNTDPSIL